jgi:hypothetical protein
MKHNFEVRVKSGDTLVAGQYGSGMTSRPAICAIRAAGGKEPYCC